jgi:hypothetical protein
VGGLTFTGSSSNAENVYVWPYYSETVKAMRTAQVFEQSMSFLLDKFFPYDDLDPQLLRGLGDLDHRKFLQTFSLIYEERIYSNMLFFDFPCSTRILQGTTLSSTSGRRMLVFDVERFRRVSSICIFIRNRSDESFNRASRDLKQPKLFNDTNQTRQLWRFLSFVVILMAIFHPACISKVVVR